MNCGDVASTPQRLSLLLSRLFVLCISSSPSCFGARCVQAVLQLSLRSSSDSTNRPLNMHDRFRPFFLVIPYTPSNFPLRCSSFTGAIPRLGRLAVIFAGALLRLRSCPRLASLSLTSTYATLRYDHQRYQRHYQQRVSRV